MDLRKITKPILTRLLRRSIAATTIFILASITTIVLAKGWQIRRITRTPVPAKTS